MCWPLVTIQNGVLHKGTLLSKCITIGLQLKKRATRCSQSGCLVSVDGVNECISNKVQNSGKTYFPYFVGIFAGGQ